MYKALYLSPMIPSHDLQKTGLFFKEILSFIPYMDTETYSIYHKDNRTIHLLRAGMDIGQMEFYLEVDNIESLWVTIKDKLTGVKVKEPFDTEYGMREIHIGVPHTNTLLYIGQVIK